MNIGKFLSMSSLLIILSCSSVVSASVVNLTTEAYGSAKDNTSDGVFDYFYIGIDAQAQVTHYLNIYTVTRGMLEFDLSSITSPVSNASINFTMTGGSGPNTFVNLFGYTGDGIVDISDAYSGDILLSTFDANSMGGYNIDVTNFINDSLSNSSQYAGFNFRVTSEYTSNIYGYKNRIHIIPYDAVPFYRPSISITSVPLPASIWLFLSAIPALLILSRKK